MPLWCIVWQQIDKTINGCPTFYSTSGTGGSDDFLKKPWSLISEPMFTGILRLSQKFILLRYWPFQQIPVFSDHSRENFWFIICSTSGSHCDVKKNVLLLLQLQEIGRRKLSHCLCQGKLFYENSWEFLSGNHTKFLIFNFFYWLGWTSLFNL